MATRLDNIISSASKNWNAKANNALIDALYMEFLNRKPTANEYKRFSTMSAKDAANTVAGKQIVTNQTVASNTVATGNTGNSSTNNTTNNNIAVNNNGISEYQKAELDKLNKEIDAWEGMSNEQRAVLKQIAAGDYTSGQTVLSKQQLSEIISQAATNAEADLSPYYQETSRRELEDLQNAMADIRNQSARYAQQEALSYKEKLASTKQSLRTRGLTFSGINRATLGEESALSEKPGQLYAEGQEGSLATQRRYDIEDKRAGFQEKARDLGLAGERLLGSANVDTQGQIVDPYKNGNKYNRYDPNAMSSLYDPRQSTNKDYIGTGDLTLEKIKEIEKSKWDRISKYRANI